MRGKKFLGVFLVLAAIAGLTGLVMLLWNAILPQIAAIGVINYWQALGLMVLGRLLFGGFGHGGKLHSHFHHKFPGRDCSGYQPQGHEDVREMHRKMRSMSRSERKDYIRSHMRDFHGMHDPFCEKEEGERPADGQ